MEKLPSPGFQEVKVTHFSTQQPNNTRLLSLQPCCSSSFTSSSPSLLPWRRTLSFLEMRIGRRRGVAGGTQGGEQRRKGDCATMIRVQSRRGGDGECSLAENGKHPGIYGFFFFFYLLQMLKPELIFISRRSSFLQPQTRQRLTPQLDKHVFLDMFWREATTSRSYSPDKY